VDGNMQVGQEDHLKPESININTAQKLKTCKFKTAEHSWNEDHRIKCVKAKSIPKKAVTRKLT
jgi:hypothetical protein